MQTPRSWYQTGKLAIAEDNKLAVVELDWRYANGEQDWRYANSGKFTPLAAWWPLTRRGPADMYIYIYMFIEFARLGCTHFIYLGNVYVHDFINMCMYTIV